MKNKVLAFVTALLLVAVSGFAQVEKDEIVYARLGPDGEPTDTYVVNAFCADEAGAYEDHGAYASAVSLTPGLTATMKDCAVSLRLPAGRSYYQGAPSALILPWVVRVAYWLDGVVVDPSTLPGQDGHLRIEMTVAENPAAADDWYDAYTLQVTATLDADLCDDLVAEGATIVSAGSDYTASWIVLPGNESVLTFEADVEDFQMDPIQFAGVRLNLSIDDSLYSGSLDVFSTAADTLSTNASELKTSLDDVKDAADALSEGATTLGDTMEAFEEKLTDANGLPAEYQAILTGYQDIVSGIDELATGVSAANTAAGQVDTTASMFAAGIKQVDVDAMVNDALGGEFTMHSFMSDQNMDTRSVQFVLMTPGIN